MNVGVKNIIGLIEFTVPRIQNATIIYTWRMGSCQSWTSRHKLSATKIELSHWSTGHSIHLGLADKIQMNL